MTLIAVLVAVGTLVLLIAVVKLHPFVAFLIAAIVAALLLGRPVGILRS
jgi:Gnt-I system high-affinity gluconate transporter